MYVDKILGKERDDDALRAFGGKYIQTIHLLITQKSTDPPEIVILRNDTGIGFSSIYFDAGKYRIKFAQDIFNDVTSIEAHNGKAGGDFTINMMGAYLEDNQTVAIASQLNLAYANDNLNNNALIIQIYKN